MYLIIMILHLIKFFKFNFIKKYWNNLMYNILYILLEKIFK